MGGTNTAAGVGTAERIAAAAVSVVARDGFDILSVRTVAREAGLSGGAVQYYYATRAELLLAAFRHTVTSITERLAGIDLSGPLPVVLGRLGREALPLDTRRHRECVVWVALRAAAAADPQLAAEHASALHALTGTLVEAITTARAAELIRETVDPAKAAAILVAVLDGLTLHGITGSPGADTLTATLDAAIDLVLLGG